MTAVLACIDGSRHAAGVADAAAWAARRLGCAVELLMAMPGREGAGGGLVAGAKRRLIDELATLSAERGRLSARSARLDLEIARARIEAQGVAEVRARLRAGDLVAAIAAAEAGHEMVVIGRRGAGALGRDAPIGRNLERVARASGRPVLIAPHESRPVARALIAFDGGPASLKAVDHVSRSPLFRDVVVELLAVAPPTGAVAARAEAAAARLRAGGLVAHCHISEGRADSAIVDAVRGLGVDLLVMGAYGHSRLRSLMLGSVTSEMIRACEIPILLFR